MPPPPSNHRKQLSHPVGLGPQPHHHIHHAQYAQYDQQTHRTRRPVRENRHPPVSNFFLEIQDTPAPRLSAASIIPIPPSVRQSTVTTLSDADDIFRASPVAPDLPALPAGPLFQSPTGSPPKPTKAERYKQRYLNRQTLPARVAPTTTLAAPPAHPRGRARTQSLGSASSSSTSTAEPQRGTTGHYHRRSPSNQTLPAIEERPLPALPRRIITIPDSRDPSSTHVHFTTTQPSKSVPHAGPCDPPRLARTSDDSRVSEHPLLPPTSYSQSPTPPLPTTTTTTPYHHYHRQQTQPSTTTSPNTMSGSPTSTLVHPSPLQEREPSPTKTTTKKSILSPLKYFKRNRSLSIGCPPATTTTTTTTTTDTTNTNSEQQKRSTTPTPSKFSSLPAISTARISRPMARSISASTPVPRHRHRHHGDMSAAVKRVRRVTPLTEVDMYSKKNWRSSFMEERKVPEYKPPADSYYAR